MIKVYGYYRVSTALQAETGYSLEQQENEIKSYCKKQGWQLVQLFSDEGISGAVSVKESLDLSKRPGLCEMLDSLEGIDLVVVAHTNRLWRNSRAAVLVQERLYKAEVDVASIQQPDYSIFDEIENPERYLTNSMKDVIASYEKASITKKLMAGKKSKLANGLRASGNPPFGYQWALDENKKKVVVPAPGVAGVVKALFNKFLELGSVNAVATWLNQEGIKTNQGKAWTAPSVRVVLMNSFYRGELIWKGVKYPANHQAIISPVQFGKVQAALQRNKKR